MSNSLGDGRGLTTPILSPLNFQTSNDPLMGIEEPSYPDQNNELVATEDVNSFKIGLEEQPTYLDPEIEDISSALENRNPATDWDSPIAPVDEDLVSRNDAQRTDIDNFIPSGMPQAQQMQQVVEDDQPMMLNNVVPVAVEVSPAAKNPDRGGCRRVKKPTKKDSPCKVSIKKCRVYVEKRKRRTVYADESAKKTGKRAVAKSNSQRFRHRNKKEEDNLKKLKENKQKDLDTELAALEKDVQLYNNIVLQFPSEARRLYYTTLDLSQHQLKPFAQEYLDDINWNVDFIKNYNLNQKMLDVEQFFEDDQDVNSAMKLEEEVKRKLTQEESERSKRKTKINWNTMSDKEKRMEQNRIASAKCRIREKLRKEMLGDDIIRIETKWEHTKDEKQRVANMLLQLRNEVGILISQKRRFF
ncbi:hypothetical protein WR25_10755 isoform B [Diploscapter pachys]|uniref:BZIP domain-containing protein n=1 Tax=Diploscapter pachys TaxID=2018661 RepID=A0A2A2JBM7_9BILA|nr:hypothetical protein WR25_10755 isoform B [Diploscapter pachys]